MSLKEAWTEVRIPCYFHMMDGSTLEHCKKCSFYNGTVEENGELKGVDCLRTEIGSIRAHVTRFEKGDYVYESRYYDKEIDGPIEGDDPYDFCQKCCFLTELKNGNNICLLRCSTGDDMDEKTAFMCYEGEIWTKRKVENED